MLGRPAADFARAHRSRNSSWRVPLVSDCDGKCECRLRCSKPPPSRLSIPSTLPRISRRGVQLPASPLHNPLVLSHPLSPAHSRQPPKRGHDHEVSHNGTSTQLPVRAVTLSGNASVRPQPSRHPTTEDRRGLAQFHTGPLRPPSFLARMHLRMRMGTGTGDKRQGTALRRAMPSLRARMGVLPTRTEDPPS